MSRFLAAFVALVLPAAARAEDMTFKVDSNLQAGVSTGS